MGQVGLEGEVGSIHQHVAAARQRLRQAGVSDTESELSARLLAEFALDWSTERLLVDGRQSAPHEFAATYAALIDRRAAREPLAYITGRREFWGLSLIVSPDVLIPRSETELLVEAALELFPGADAPIQMADACTGSGCVAIALACERPRAHVVATDISSAAVVVARRNVIEQNVASRVRVVVADVLDGVDGPFDLITGNPPYVLERSRPGLQPEVRDHEPAVALFGGDDGLRIVARLITAAEERLRLGGYLLFEFGYGQDEEVEGLLAASRRLELVELRRDLQGIARTAVARLTR